MTHNLPLKGCTAEPLANYLKALGVLRLVVEQGFDPRARGYWQGDHFCLETPISQGEITAFFLHEYRPTPLVNPWNGSTGFYPKDKAQKKLLQAFQTTAERFASYGHTISTAQAQVDALGLTKQPKDQEKQRLLVRLRNTLPEEAVQWIDTCALVTSDEEQGLRFPPLTGTGGNDGNFEFSRTFMQQLQVLFDLKTGQPVSGSDRLLKAAIFHEVLPGLSFSGKIGQFNPIAAGGANAAPGYDANSRVNPWDFILMLEGTLLFLSGLTRRQETSHAGELAYPFTVRPANVGYGSASEGDKARAELWTPLWSSPTSLSDLQTVFREGRAKVGTRAAIDGVDFAQSIASFGVRRGLDQFVRYGFQERNGLSYFAVPLGRFQPHHSQYSALLSDIDGWLLRLKGEAQKDTAPASLRRSHRQLQSSIVKLAQQSSSIAQSSDLLEVLVALGQVDAALDLSLRSAEQKFPPPAPFLRQGWKWVHACKDNSPEFRLALALAGQDLRERLVWVRRNERGYPRWLKNDDGRTIWQRGALTQNLMALLKRQEVEALQQQRSDSATGGARDDDRDAAPPKPFAYPVAPLEDVALWIAGALDDDRITEIARGLSLINLKGYTTDYHASQATHPVPAAYALVKLVHDRHLTKSRLSPAISKIFKDRNGSAIDIALPDQPLPLTSGLLNQLATGNLHRATAMAAQRLHASGYSPALREGIYEPADRVPRIAAALAFPLSPFDTARLLKQVCRMSTQVDIDEEDV
jgi:CRISPR-associated protein Csx17